MPTLTELKLQVCLRGSESHGEGMIVCAYWALDFFVCTFMLTSPMMARLWGVDWCSKRTPLQADSGLSFHLQLLWSSDHLGPSTVSWHFFFVFSFSNTILEEQWRKKNVQEQLLHANPMHIKHKLKNTTLLSEPLSDVTKSDVLILPKPMHRLGVLVKSFWNDLPAVSSWCQLLLHHSNWLLPPKLQINRSSQNN